MDGISTTPLEDSVAFLKLRDQHKANLLEDSRLTKAAGLAAQQELLLKGPQDAGWKVPRLKSLNTQLRVWSKKIRQPGESSEPGLPYDEDDEEGNLAVGPTQKFMGNIAKLTKRISRPAKTPKTPSSAPKVKTPKTKSIKKTPSSYKPASSGSKPKFSTLSPDIYESTTEFESAPETLTPSTSSATQAAHALVEKAATQSIAFAKNKAQEWALKKLAPQPGWKHFKSPVKKKLHGYAWLPYQKKLPKK